MGMQEHGRKKMSKQTEFRERLTVTLSYLSVQVRPVSLIYMSFIRSSF
jgi:hypothetical protein